VGRRLADGEHIRAPDASHYFLGVARNVLREAWARGPGPDELTDEQASRVAHDPDAAREDGTQAETWASCLERCLDRLPAESRHLVLAYHQDQKRLRIDGRREIAERLGVGLNALRIRVHRLRGVLEACVRACVDVASPGEGK
jgi:DNA-directed RNA polymerase specialized sigma24 family protein